TAAARSSAAAQVASRDRVRAASGACRRTAAPVERAGRTRPRPVWCASSSSDHRAGARSTPKTRHGVPAVSSPPDLVAHSVATDPLTLTKHYEAARALVVGDTAASRPVIGLTVLYRWGLPAWLHV